ncbi:MFS transporter [Nocardia sp. IFM 10818]
MDLTVLNLGAPHLSADLRPTSTQMLWIVDIYGFLLAGSLLTMGPLGDRIGRRRLLLIGAVAFGAVSVLAAFSPSATALIAARALLGVAAASLAPSTLSLLRHMFRSARDRTIAISVWSASFAFGAAIGPLLGGVMLTHFWWGSVFLINVPIMAALLALGPVYLPEHRSAKTGRIDVVSSGLSLAAVLGVIFGVKNIAEHGTPTHSAAAVLLGLAAAVAFLRRQRWLADPLIDLSLFRSRVFSTAFTVSVVVFFVNFGSYFLIAQYLQLVLGLSPIQAGVWALPSTAASIVGSILTPRLLAQVRPGHVVTGGFLMAAAGLAVLAQLGRAPGLPVVITGAVTLALGLAPIIILTADLIVGAAPPDQAGAASGLSEASTELGGALGIALLGSAMTAVYRNRVSDTTFTALPEDSLAAVQDTLACAVDIAAHLPPHTAATLLHTAGNAYTDGMVLAMGIGTAVALAAALAAAILLRIPSPAPQSETSARDRTE